MLAMAMYALTAEMYAVTDLWFQMVYNVCSFAFASMSVFNLFWMYVSLCSVRGVVPIVIAPWYSYLYIANPNDFKSYLCLLFL